MSDKTAKLAEALGLELGSLPRFGSPAFHSELRRQFSRAYPSIVTMRMQGQALLTEQDLSRRTLLAVARKGLQARGTLELLSADDILKDRPSGMRSQLGKGTLAEIEGFLQRNRKQLRNPVTTSYFEAAKSAFGGKPARVPATWLIFEEAITLGQQQALLRDWGIHCLGDICNVPQNVLALLSDPREEMFFDTGRLQKIQKVLEKMRLNLK